MVRAHFAGLDGSGLRDDVGAWGKVSRLVTEGRTSVGDFLPFQTERAQSARVGNIAT
jgi:hypothetical protein